MCITGDNFACNFLSVCYYIDRREKRNKTLASKNIMAKQITLTEQEVLELDDLLKQTLEEGFISHTLRKVLGNIIIKLEK